MKWALGFLGGIALLAVGVPAVSFWDPTAFSVLFTGDPLPPSWVHFLGTDDLGRDILVRCIYGARISLMVGVISISISLSIGVIVGLISGFYQGVVDQILMRLVDVFLAIPTLFLILIIQAILTPSIFNVMVIIGLTSWMGVARLVRAEVLSTKARVFVTAGMARGLSNRAILFKHILPHTLSPVIVAGVLGMGSAILTESVLSFLGLGVQPPHASWGNMLQGSLAYMTDAPWMTIIPGILITLTVLSLNVIGDYLQQNLLKRG
jgi:peptide/nickel transport system permease protein